MLLKYHLYKLKVLKLWILTGGASVVVTGAVVSVTQPSDKTADKSILPEKPFKNILSLNLISY